MCRLCLYLEARLLHKKAGNSIQDAERYLTLYAAAAGQVQDATTSVSTSVLAEPSYRLHASRLKLAINGCALGCILLHTAVVLSDVILSC